MDIRCAKERREPQILLYLKDHTIALFFFIKKEKFDASLVISFKTQKLWSRRTCGSPLYPGCDTCALL